MFAIGFITCMLLGPVLGKAVLSNDTVCDLNEEFRRNSDEIHTELSEVFLSMPLNESPFESKESFAMPCKIWYYGRCSPRRSGLKLSEVSINVAKPYRKNHHVSGCFCKDGHYVDENNKCHPLKSCKSEKLIDFDPKCDENEEYSTSKCSERPQRCEYTSEGKEVQRFSNMCFAPGCYCKKGFVLDENYKCVQPKDCPPHPENSRRYGGYGRKRRDINQENKFEIQNTTEIIEKDEGTPPKVNNSTEVKFTLNFKTDDIEKAYGCLEDSVNFVARCMVKENTVFDL